MAALARCRLGCSPDETTGFILLDLLATDWLMVLRRLVQYAISLARGLIRGYVHRILLPIVLVTGFLFGLAAALVLFLVFELGPYISLGGGLVVTILTIIGLFRFVIVRLLDSVERRIRP